MVEISIVAGDLVAALKGVGKKKPLPVDIWFEAEQGVLIVEEALYGLFATEAQTSGLENTSAQVNGRLLHAIAMRHPADATLDLGFGGVDLTVKRGGSIARLPAMRVDRKPMPRNPKRQGPVTAVPDGRYRTPKGETWIFSAQVPFTPDAGED